MSERIVCESAIESPPQSSLAQEDAPIARVAPTSTGSGLIPEMYGGNRAETAKATAGEAIQTPSTSLPYADELQPLMPGIDLSTVMAHVGGEAGAMANQIGANAFTAGDHVVLPESPSKHTVAHEVAHVVQQRKGVAPSGGIGKAGDAHEQEADEIASHLVAGKQVDVAAPDNASQTSVQMEGLEPEDMKARRGYENSFRQGWSEAREDTASPKANDPFTGGHGTKQDVGGKQLGQGGFGARLIDGSAAAAQAHTGSWGDVAVPVKPVTEPLDKAHAAQAASVEKNSTGDYEGAFSADPSWLAADKKYSVAWATENMSSIERYKFEQWRWAGAYSDWSPLANASHTAMAELVETAGLMGFDTTKDKDSARFIQGLEMSLDMANQVVDAKMLGGKKDQSWSTRNDDPTAVSKAQPQLGGEQLSPKLDGVNAAYRELQTAHHGIYLGLLGDRKKALAAENGKVTGELAEINETIEFWAGMGEFVQGNAKRVKPLVTGKTGAALDKKFGSDGSHHAKHELKQAKNSAHAAEKDPSNYQADIDAHAHAGNYEDHYDTWGKGGAQRLKEGNEEGGGEESAGAEAGEMEMPELSVGGVIKMGLTLLNQKKLDELKAHLSNIESQQTANGTTIQMVQTRQAEAAFSAALTKLDEEMKKLGTQSMRDREQDMVSFGHDLDSYAVEHKRELQKQHADGLVPNSGTEIYGTAMACVAKVEKYRAMSKLALGVFPYNDFVSSIHGMGRERAGITKPEESAGRSYEKTGRPPPTIPNLTEEEQAVYQQIAGSYLMLLQTDAHWSVRLEGIVQRFHALMKKVSGNANVKHSVGKAF